MTEFDAWLAALPESQRQAIEDHLRWLDGRMPSAAMKEERWDFSRAPLSMEHGRPQRIWKNRAGVADQMKEWP